MKLSLAPSSAAARVIPAAILCTIIFGGDVFVVKEISRSSAKLQETNGKLAEAEAAKKELVALEELWRELEPDALKLAGYFLEEKDVPQFLEDVEGLAAAANISITSSITPPKTGEDATGKSKKPAPRTFPVFTFVFTVEGGFAGMMTFFAKLEQFPVVVKVKQINIQAHEKARDSVRATISVIALTQQ